MQTQYTALEKNHELTCLQVTRLHRENDGLRATNQKLVVDAATFQHDLREVSKRALERQETLQTELQTIREEKGKIATNLERTEQQYSELNKKCTWLENQKEHSDKKLKIVNEISRSRQTEIFQLKVKVRMLEGRSTEDTNQAKQYEARMKVLLDEAAAKDVTVRQTLDYVEQLEAQKTELEQTLKTLKTSHAQITSQLHSGSKDNSGLRRELEHTRNKLRDTVEQNAKETERMADNKRELELRGRRMKALLDKAQQEINSLKAQLEERGGYLSGDETMESGDDSPYG